MFANKIFAAAALSVAMLSNASAGVVYENGTDGAFIGGNNPFNYTVVTQAFTLGQTSTFNSLIYNAYTTASNNPINNVFVSISQGGSTIYSGNFGVANTAKIGSANNYYDLTDYTVNFSNVTLNAGTYTLGLMVSPLQTNEHWSIIQGAGPVASDGFSHYFRLEANAQGASVPEPTGIALLGLAFAGMFLARRRKQS